MRRNGKTRVEFELHAERAFSFAVFLGLAEWAKIVKDQRLMIVANSGRERVNYGAHKLRFDSTD